MPGSGAGRKLTSAVLGARPSHPHPTRAWGAGGDSASGLREELDSGFLPSLLAEAGGAFPGDAAQEDGPTRLRGQAPPAGGGSASFQHISDGAPWPAWRRPAWEPELPSPVLRHPVQRGWADLPQTSLEDKPGKSSGLACRVSSLEKRREGGTHTPLTLHQLACLPVSTVPTAAGPAA